MVPENCSRFAVKLRGTVKDPLARTSNSATGARTFPVNGIDARRRRPAADAGADQGRGIRARGARQERRAAGRAAVWVAVQHRDWRTGTSVDGTPTDHARGDGSFRPFAGRDWRARHQDAQQLRVGARTPAAVGGAARLRQGTLRLAGRATTTSRRSELSLLFGRANRTSSAQPAVADGMSNCATSPPVTTRAGTTCAATVVAVRVIRRHRGRRLERRPQPGDRKRSSATPLQVRALDGRRAEVVRIANATASKHRASSRRRGTHRRSKPRTVSGIAPPSPPVAEAWDGRQPVPGRTPARRRVSLRARTPLPPPLRRQHACAAEPVAEPVAARRLVNVSSPTGYGGLYMARASARGEEAGRLRERRAQAARARCPRRVR